MAAIRRNWWRAFLVVGIIGLLATLGWWPGFARDGGRGLPEAVAKLAEPYAIDEVTYERVSALRGELCLSDADLAAVGCSQAQAEAVLSGLLRWYAQNKTRLEEAERACRIASADLRELNTKIRVGPRDEMAIASLPRHQVALAEARAGRASLIEEAAAAAGASMPAQGLAIWAAARSREDLPDRFRYAPELSAEQVAALKQAYRRYHNDPERLEPLVAATLSSGQAMSLAAAAENAKARGAGIASASATVLPPPSNKAEGR